LVLCRAEARRARRRRQKGVAAGGLKVYGEYDKREEESMKRMMMAAAMAAVVCTAAAEDTHAAKTAEVMHRFEIRIEALRADADAIDLAMGQLNRTCKGTAEARTAISNLVAGTVWRDLRSRETRRNRTAQEEAKRKLDHAELLIKAAEGELRVVDNGDQRAWVRGETTAKKADSIVAEAAPVPEESGRVRKPKEKRAK